MPQIQYSLKFCIHNKNFPLKSLRHSVRDFMTYFLSTLTNKHSFQGFQGLEKSVYFKFFQALQRPVRALYHMTQSYYLNPLELCYI